MCGVLFDLRAAPTHFLSTSLFPSRGARRRCHFRMMCAPEPPAAYLRDFLCPWGPSRCHVCRSLVCALVPFRILAACCRYPILVEEGDDGPALGERVNKVEHGWQSYITNLVVNGLISWDGKDPKSLKVPEGYQFLEAKY